LIPQGCNTKDYEKNPIVTWMHDYYSLPVGKITAIKRDAESISAKIVFATRPENHPENEEWFPDVVFSMYQQKVLSAFSVGFDCVESRPATDRDLEKYGAGCRRVTNKWELFEVGCVTIPCNQEAVATAVSKGFIPQDIAAKCFTKSEQPVNADSPQDSPEQKAAIGNCAKCGKEFPMDDMQEMDGEDGLFCADCRDGMKTAAEVPIRKTRVYHMNFDKPTLDAAKASAIAADQLLAKLRGRIYYL
jgi:HK97 family phage prohead protease